MRTTVTLNRDAVAKPKAGARRSGKSLNETINDAIRRGLVASAKRSVRFKVKARSLGEGRAGLNLDKVGQLIERVEGSKYR